MFSPFSPRNHGSRGHVKQGWIPQNHLRGHGYASGSRTYRSKARRWQRTSAIGTSPSSAGTSAGASDSRTGLGLGTSAGSSNSTANVKAQMHSSITSSSRGKRKSTARVYGKRQILNSQYQYNRNGFRTHRKRGNNVSNASNMSNSSNTECNTVKKTHGHVQGPHTSRGRARAPSTPRQKHSRTNKNSTNGGINSISRNRSKSQNRAVSTHTKPRTARINYDVRRSRNSHKKSENSREDGSRGEGRESEKVKTYGTSRSRRHGWAAIPAISRYHVGKTIGEGTFGKVKCGRHKLTNIPVNYYYRLL